MEQHRTEGLTRTRGRGQRASRLPASQPAAADVLRQAQLSLFEASPFGIAVLDAAGTVIDANDALSRMLGRDRHDLLGRAFADWVSPEDRAHVAALLGKLVAGALPRVALEAVAVALPAPASAAVSLHAVPVEIGGAFAGALIHASDASERRDQQARTAHAERLYTLGQLAGSIAHDFNNLIAAMLGFCDLLLTRHRASEPDYDDLSQIRGTALRARDLVRQLLAFARRQPLRPVRLNVNRAVGDLRPMLRGLLGPNIALDMQCAEPLPRIRMDHASFDQAMVNLAINARDAMPDGGVLHVRCSAIDVDAPMVRDGETMSAGTYVAIEVADTGCGIPADVMEHIFEPFFSTKHANGGTGLGLATVWGIVRQSGGYIDVDSVVGEGARFRLYLPAMTSRNDAGPRGEPAPGGTAPAGSGREESLRPVAGGGRRVLLVEDEAPVRTFAARALRGRGFTILEAEDGDAALTIIGAEPSIDLLLTDLRLPGADGRQVIEEALRRFPQARVVIISADPDPDLAAADRRPQISLLPKPFTLAELAQAVQRAIVDDH